MNKFKNIISLGGFCSPALELQRIGIRLASYPFNWLITPSLKTVLELIENHFEDFLSEKLLYQIKEYPKHYRNIKYNIDFYHDFDDLKSLKKQIGFISEKYNRRINRFYDTIQTPTLFIRYIMSSTDLEYICKNYQKILIYLKTFHSNNDIIFVANSDLLTDDDLGLKIWYVDKDKDDIVAREFLDKNKELKDYILYHFDFDAHIVHPIHVAHKKSLLEKALRKICKKLSIYYHHKLVVHENTK